MEMDLAWILEVLCDPDIAQLLLGQAVDEKSSGHHLRRYDLESWMATISGSPMEQHEEEEAEKLADEPEEEEEDLGHFFDSKKCSEAASAPHKSDTLKEPVFFHSGLDRQLQSFGSWPKVPGLSTSVHQRN